MARRDEILDGAELNSRTQPEKFSNVLVLSGLNFACRHCHIPGSKIDKTDEELMAAAKDYHSAPAEAQP